MTTETITIDNALLEVSTRAFSALLLDASTERKDGNWDHVIGAIKRHGFLDVIESEPFSALGWKRIPIECDRDRLGDDEYRRGVARTIAEQWVARLMRKASDADKIVLLKLDAAIVIKCLHERFVSHLTGSSVTQTIMRRDFDENVVDVPAVGEALKMFDRKMDAVARVLSHRLETSSRRHEIRMERRAAQAKRELDTHIGLVKRLMDTEHQLSDLKREVARNGHKEEGK